MPFRLVELGPSISPILPVRKGILALRPTQRTITIGGSRLRQPHVIAGTTHRGGYCSATDQPAPRLCRGTFATARSSSVTAAPFGGGEVHEHVIAHRLPTVVEHRPQPPIDHRDRLSLEHGREGASAVVLHQRGCL